MQRQVPSFQTMQKTVEVLQPVPQERIQERITEQVVDIPLPRIMEEMMEVERSTWQNRCVLRGCADVDVVRHAFHLAQILRAQAIRSQVSSRSVVTESIDGSLAVFPDSPDFFGFFQLGKVQIVSASGSSSELSPHQMAIRSHPEVQKMPASGISSELSAHQMAPAGAIAHSRAHLCPRASPFSFSSLASPLWPLGLGVIGSLRLSVFYLLRRCGRRSGQPSSSSLARRVCVHLLPFSSPAIAVYGYKYSSSSSTGTP